ncbi:hypothetical protein E0H75_30630 [Kribbella capetownensis]|uniref:Uncharacterized protein n=1 Tax=Kribbella capetownensis TaxID=1572659 RepID=A0A4R0JJX6_9ACTN|nr:hypothetical protein [Kribbella capetownensis]TCC46054.1 hypothetical protein E0H75_30630 [Kribbella capetownensis]
MTHTTQIAEQTAVTKRRAARFRRLDHAMQAVFNDVLDYCDAICEEAEQHLGTTDEDIIVDDPAYAEALDLFGFVFDLKNSVQTDLRSKWIGDG